MVYETGTIDSFVRFFGERSKPGFDSVVFAQLAMEHPHVLLLG
jgi:hypothetical protein